MVADENAPAADDTLARAERLEVEVEALRSALRDLVKCHGMPPSPDCGYLRTAKELLGDRPR